MSKFTEQQIQSEMSRLRGLKSCREKPEAELHDLAIQSLTKKSDTAMLEALFSDKGEARRAKVLIEKYLEEYSIESISDRELLKQLVYLEILNVRLQDTLNDHHKKKNSIPLNLVDTIHKNINEITDIKEKLGISSLQRGDAFEYIEKLKKKFRVWLEENQASRHMRCPYCKQEVLLRIKTDIYDAQKHPFFKDRVLGNKHLIDLYKRSILTKEDVAKIFETSTDYIEWLIKKSPWRKDD